MYDPVTEMDVLGDGELRVGEGGNQSVKRALGPTLDSSDFDVIDRPHGRVRPARMVSSRHLHQTATPWRSLSAGMKALLAGFACAACAWLPAPALAAARVDDAAATQAYLRALQAYARGASAEAGANVAAIEAHANQIAGECPDALTYAPRDAAFEELAEEVETTLQYAGWATLRSATLRFADALGRLTWSNHELTRLVRAEAAEESAEAKLALPDVCADVAAWRASAYAALPQSTREFLARAEAIGSGSTIGPSEESREAAIARLLKPYEGPAERRTAKRIKELETRTEKRVSAAVSSGRAKVAAALGVSAL
jgi:hypothetical protein